MLVLVFIRAVNIDRTPGLIRRSNLVLGVPDAVWDSVLPGRFLYCDPLSSTLGRKPRFVSAADITAGIHRPTQAPVSKGPGNTIAKASVPAIDQYPVTAHQAPVTGNTIAKASVPAIDPSPVTTPQAPVSKGPGNTVGKASMTAPGNRSVSVKEVKSK